MDKYDAVFCRGKFEYPYWRGGGSWRQVVVGRYFPEKNELGDFLRESGTILWMPSFLNVWISIIQAGVSSEYIEKRKELNWMTIDHSL